MQLFLLVTISVVASRLLSLFAADCCTYTLLRRFGDAIACLACGILIALAFGHLLPEAYEHGVTICESAIGLSIAFAFFWLLEALIHQFFPHTHEEPILKRNCALVGGGTRLEVRLCGSSEAKALPVLIGVVAHNVVDGIVIAMAFLTDLHAGIVVCLGMTAHEIAPLVSQMTILHTLGISRRHVLLSLGAALMSAPLAALLCLQLLHASELHVGYAMLISTASFFYVIVFILKNVYFGSSFKNRKTTASLWLLLGMAICYLTVTFLHFGH